MNEHDTQGNRVGMKEVEVELLQKKSTSVIVVLPNGDIVTRKNKFVVKES